MTSTMPTGATAAVGGGDGSGAAAAATTTTTAPPTTAAVDASKRTETSGEGEPDAKRSNTNNNNQQQQPDDLGISLRSTIAKLYSVVPENGKPEVRKTMEAFGQVIDVAEQRAKNLENENKRLHQEVTRQRAAVLEELMNEVQKIWPIDEPVKQNMQALAQNEAFQPFMKGMIAAHNKKTRSSVTEDEAIGLNIAGQLDRKLRDPVRNAPSQWGNAWGGNGGGAASGSASDTLAALKKATRVGFDYVKGENGTPDIYF